MLLQRRQIAEIEDGTANPTLETLKKIGRLFGFEVGFVSRRHDLRRVDASNFDFGSGRRKQQTIGIRPRRARSIARRV